MQVAGDFSDRTVCPFEVDAEEQKHACGAVRDSCEPSLQEGREGLVFQTSRKV